MSDARRVILIDPCARTRSELQRLLKGLGGVALVETCTGFEAALPRPGAVAADVALVVVGDDPGAALAAVEAVARTRPGVAVVAAGAAHDAALILRSVRAGAREFLPWPSTASEVAEMFRRLAPRPDHPSPAESRGPRLIAVAGAAGGVGCTSLAFNLAATFAKTTPGDTLLVDFDLLFGTLGKVAGTGEDLALDGLLRHLDRADPDHLRRTVHRHRSGPYVLPHPSDLEEAARIDPEALGRAIELFKDAFGTVVVDTSKGLQATDFLAFEAADVVLVVLELNLCATRNTHRLLQYLRQFEGLADKVRLVVNRWNSPLSEINPKKAEEILKATISWQIPNATKLYGPARSKGVPIDEVAGGPGSKAHQAILEIAEALRPSPPAAKPRRRFFPAFR